jgi:UDP-GlcNAc:undecaprenyl-phosphate GlcNAc-1-phosphate transferase
MDAIVFVFLIALMVTAFSTPGVRRLAIWLGFVDAPAQRKLHSTPMPLLGGVAIVLGTVIALVFIFGDLAPFRSPQVRGILLASSLMAAVGLFDDRVGLPIWAKVAAQLGGVVILAAFDVHVKLPVPEWLNYAITILWVTGISNAINFLDNMDGLSAGISAVIAGFILLLGTLNEQYLVGGVAAALLGASLGFLRYNFKPARIFMGDAGSLFLGFLLAVLGIEIRFPANTNAVTWMVPVFLFAVPIFDMTLVVFSRLRRGVSPGTAGKDHTSHRLVRLGFSQREAVLILYLFAGMAGMVGIFLTQAMALEAYLIAGLLGVLALYAIWWLDTRVPA